MIEIWIIRGEIGFHCERFLCRYPRYSEPSIQDGLALCFWDFCDRMFSKSLRFSFEESKETETKHKLEILMNNPLVLISPSDTQADIAQPNPLPA